MAAQAEGASHHHGGRRRALLAAEDGAGAAAQQRRPEGPVGLLALQALRAPVLGWLVCAGRQSRDLRLQIGDCGETNLNKRTQ